MVGGRHMGMGPHHDARPPVEEMPEALLLAGRLGVEVDDDGVRLFAHRAGRDQIVGAGEGIVEIGMHEHPAHDVGDQHPRAVLRLEQARAVAGRAGRIVRRPDEAVLPSGEGQRLALVPDVVAGGHRIGARLQRALEDLLGDAEAAGRVLAIDDDEVELPVGDQAGQPVEDGGPSGAADHVAEKEKSHRARLSLSVPRPRAAPAHP